jgi:hypothetical protein
MAGTCGDNALTVRWVGGRKLPVTVQPSGVHDRTKEGGFDAMDQVDNRYVWRERRLSQEVNRILEIDALVRRRGRSALSFLSAHLAFLSIISMST